jgi:hypothetical protein
MFREILAFCEFYKIDAKACPKMLLKLTYKTAERDCYSEDEISLKYLPRDHGYRYEMSNCLFESAFENILEKCKCFPGKH